MSRGLGDSKLIVNQVKGEYEVRHEDLIPYYQAAIEFANVFDGFYISHVSRLQNTKADTLVALAATLASPASNTIQRVIVATRQLLYAKYSLQVKEVYATSTDFKRRYW